MNIIAKIKDSWKKVETFLDKPIVHATAYLIDVGILLYLIAIGNEPLLMFAWLIIVIIHSMRLLHKAGFIKLPTK